MFFRIFFVAILFSSMAFLSQCKKYAEDDVFIQWKRPEKRLIKFGPWKFEKITVDGFDKSEEFRADSAYFTEIRFFEPAYTLGHTMHIDRQAGLYYEIGKYEFDEKNSILKIGAAPTYVNHSDYPNYGPLFEDEYIEWEILRLSKKGMTLKTNYNSSEYILYLKSSH